MAFPPKYFKIFFIAQTPQGLLGHWFSPKMGRYMHFLITIQRKGSGAWGEDVPIIAYDSSRRGHMQHMQLNA